MRVAVYVQVMAQVAQAVCGRHYVPALANATFATSVDTGSYAISRGWTCIMFIFRAMAPPLAARAAHASTGIVSVSELACGWISTQRTLQQL